MVLQPLTSALRQFREQEQLVMIFISTVMIMAGQGVIAPILPLFAEDMGIGAAMIGLTLSVFALARLILNVPLGLLSDRYGRRLLLISGPLFTAVGMFGSGFAGDVTQLLIWRFVAGAGSAMYMTGAQIYLADISTAETRARFIGTNQGAILLGTSVGPALGGAVAEIWGLRAPFVLVAVMALAALAYAWWRIPETRHLAEPPPPDAARAPGEKRPRRAWVSYVLSRDFLAVSAVTMAIFFTRTAARQTILPLMGAARFGFGAGAMGALFTVQAVANAFLIVPAAYLADRRGRKIAIIPSGLLAAGAMFWVGASSTAAMFVVASIVLAMATSIAGPAPAAYAADISPPHLRGLGMGLYRSSGDIGFVIGPPLLGAIADATSYGWAMTVNAVLMGVTALFFLTARETLQRPAPARTATVEDPAG